MNISILDEWEPLKNAVKCSLITLVVNLTLPMSEHGTFCVLATVTTVFQLVKTVAEKWTCEWQGRVVPPFTSGLVC